MNPDVQDGNEAVSLQKYADAEHQLAGCAECGTHTL